MALSDHRRIADIIDEAGTAFGREDLARVNAVLARMDLDEAHEAEALAHEAILLIASTPGYGGDLKPEDVG